MNKFLLLFTVLLTLDVQAFNTKYNKLIPGKEILVDVAKQEVISLTLDTKNADSSVMPQLTVLNQWGNFLCSHRQTLLIYSGFDVQTGLHTNTWEIQLLWSPGADLSGCIVNISFPGMNNSRAELYMNY